MRGVTIGKFYPFHLGHDHLIRTAKAEVDRLYVVVAAPARHRYSSALRASWVCDAHSDVEVVQTDDDLAEAPGPWAERCLDLLPAPPDVAFTSEAYGPAWAEAMGARHRPVDPERRAYPVSGSAARADLGAHWHLLTPAVRAHFCRRVRVLGVESSGTTTLARALADALGTEWVPEYGREYWESRRLAAHEWTTDDFVRIASEQARREDHAARTADRVLVCDTDPFATTLWHRRYLGTSASAVRAVARGRRYDVTLLTEPDFPFEQDGTRDGEDVRTEMHGWFLDALGEGCLRLGGPPEERLRRALEGVRPLLAFPPLAP